MKKRKVFVDSDVALSSLISNKGAAHFLLNESYLELYISDISLYELERGVEKLNLNKNDLMNLIKDKLKSVKLKTKGNDMKKIKPQFKTYVFDESDAHVVAGAQKAKAKFILSYNLKHFNIQRIKEELGIDLKTPSQFLQYLRSLQ